MARSSLAYLAISGQSHRRDALATLLRSEFDQRRARAELRRAKQKAQGEKVDSDLAGGAQTIWGHREKRLTNLVHVDVFTAKQDPSQVDTLDV